MVIVGLDDTDVAESADTFALARELVCAIREEWRCLRIVQHQLLVHERIPCTTRNRAISILLVPRNELADGESAYFMLIHQIREILKLRCPKGSDPGLCVSPRNQIDDAVVQFGYRCQFELVRQAEALSVADASEVHLEGLGGSNAGIIGALAAVGLGARGNDGEVMQIGECSDDLVGRLAIAAIQSRGVCVTDIDDDAPLNEGVVELPPDRHPALRNDQIVLFVQKGQTGTDGGTVYQPV